MKQLALMVLLPELQMQLPEKNFSITRRISLG
jgi:hypothetical protein